MLGLSLGQGLSQGFKQGRQGSLVQSVLQDMENLDPSQFAQRVSMVEGEVGDNPALLSTLQRATQRYEEMRNQRLFRDLLEDNNFKEGDYATRVKMALKAGVPAREAVSFANDVQTGEINQARVPSALGRITQPIVEQMKILQGQMDKLDSSQFEEKSALTKQLLALNDDLRTVQDNYRNVKKNYPKAFKEMGSLSYEDLLGAWNEIEPTFQNIEERLSGKKPTQEEPKGEGERLTTGSSGAVQAINPRIGNLMRDISDLLEKSDPTRELELMTQANPALEAAQWLAKLGVEGSKKIARGITPEGYARPYDPARDIQRGQGSLTPNELMNLLRYDPDAY